MREYEDEDEDDEPSLWTRVRSLLLTLSLQLYHRVTKVRQQLQKAAGTLGDAADEVRPRGGLSPARPRSTRTGVFARSIFADLTPRQRRGRVRAADSFQLCCTCSDETIPTLVSLVRYCNSRRSSTWLEVPVGVQGL